jgi:hypothetical protein
MNFSDSTSAMIGYGQGETDDLVAEPNQISWGVYHNMGGGFKLMYEGTTYDADAAGSAEGDFDRHVFSMRLDF